MSHESVWTPGRESEWAGDGGRRLASSEKPGFLIALYPRPRQAKFTLDNDTATGVCRGGRLPLCRV